MVVKVAWDLLTMKIFIFGFMLFFLAYSAEKSFADFSIPLDSSAFSSTMVNNEGFATNTYGSIDVVELDAGFPGEEHKETYEANAWVGIKDSISIPGFGFQNYLTYTFTQGSFVESVGFWNLTDVSPIFKLSTNTTIWNKESGLKELKLFGRIGGAWQDLANFSDDDNAAGYFVLSQTDPNNKYDDIATDPSYINLMFAKEQRISLSTPVYADAIRVEIISNFRGDNDIGFAKVRFFSPASTAVPEPTSLCLFGGSVILAGAYRRFRRRSSKDGKSNLAL